MYDTISRALISLYEASNQKARTMKPSSPEIVQEGSLVAKCCSLVTSVSRQSGRAKQSRGLAPDHIDLARRHVTFCGIRASK